MTEAIINKLKQSKLFSVLCDEVSDSSNKEQLLFARDILVKIVIYVSIFLNTLSGENLAQGKNEIFGADLI